MKRTLVVAVAVLAIILAIVAYAGATPSDGTGNPRTASHSLTVSANVAPKLSLELSAASMSFPDIDPDAAPSSQALVATVRSNKIYSLTHLWTTPDTSLADDFLDLSGQPRTSGANHGVNITFTPAWSMDPDVGISGTLQFTATQ
jgi:hypothetical protein